MIKLNCFPIAEYAAITADGRLIIAGTLLQYHDGG